VVTSTPPVQSGWLLPAEMRGSGHHDCAVGAAVPAIVPVFALLTIDFVSTTAGIGVFPLGAHGEDAGAAWSWVMSVAGCAPRCPGGS
jgi:hypothetical protein